VFPADPGVVSLLGGITEKITGEAVPDVMPAIHPTSMSFAHTYVEADNSDAAYSIGAEIARNVPTTPHPNMRTDGQDFYTKGHPLMPTYPEGAICMNSYVVQL